jgi:hypothetical protein
VNAESINYCIMGRGLVRRPALCTVHFALPDSVGDAPEAKPPVELVRGRLTRKMEDRRLNFFFSRLEGSRPVLHFTSEARVIRPRGKSPSSIAPLDWKRFTILEFASGGLVHQIRGTRTSKSHTRNVYLAPDNASKTVTTP